MGKDIEYKIWGKENTIVIEDLGDLSDKTAKEVYYKADKILYKLVEKSEKIDESCRDEQITNVISFLGKRGRGKTSAMLSFYAYLNKLQRETKWSAFKNLTNTEFLFHTIECIDAAMLEGHEQVIDVILAKMWDEFNDLQSKTSYCHNKAEYDALLKTVRDKFAEARKAYLTLKYRTLKMDKEIERERDIPAASGLHELATGINLKTSLKNLVENYIKVMDYEKNTRTKVNGYLVLAIDDIDMANKSAWEVLEQIRRYMSIPNVIILITTDMERLKSVCEETCKKNSISEEDVSRFVEDYLGKVIPSNMRIYMPELDDRCKNIMISKPNDEVLKSKNLWESKFEKDILLEVFAKTHGIYFSSTRRNRHFLQNESLRGLANGFSKLVEESDYGDWLKIELQERLIARIHDSKQREFMKRMISQDYADINNYMLNFMEKNYSKLFEFGLKQYGYSMGTVLYACSILEDDDVQNAPFVDAILALYTVLLKETQGNEKFRKQIIGNNVLGAWEYIIFSGKRTGMELSGFNKRMNLEFVIDEKSQEYVVNKKVGELIVRLLDENRDEIIAWLYCWFFVNVEKRENYEFKVATNGEGLKKDTKTLGVKEEKQVANSNESQLSENSNIIQNDETQILKISVAPCMEPIKGYFNFLDRKMEYQIIFSNLLKSVIRKVYDGLSENYVEEANKAGELTTIYNKIDSISNEICESLGVDGNNMLNDDLLQSAEIIYMMGRMLEREMNKNRWSENTEVQELTSYYTAICKMLKEEEEYFEEIGEKPEFSSYFENKVQVKLLKNIEEMPQGIRGHFDKKFKSMIAWVKLKQ